MSSAVVEALQRTGLRGFVGLGVVVSLQVFNPSTALAEDEELLAMLRGERVETVATTVPSEVPMEDPQTTVHYKSKYEPEPHEWFYKSKDAIEGRIGNLPGIKHLRDNPNVEADLWDLSVSYNLTSDLNKVLVEDLENAPLGPSHSLRVHFAEDQKDVFKGRASGEGSFVGMVYTYGF